MKFVWGQKKKIIGQKMREVFSHISVLSKIASHSSEKFPNILGNRSASLSIYMGPSGNPPGKIHPFGGFLRFFCSKHPNNPIF